MSAETAIANEALEHLCQACNNSESLKELLFINMNRTIELETSSILNLARKMKGLQKLKIFGMENCSVATIDAMVAMTKAVIEAESPLTDFDLDQPGFNQEQSSEVLELLCHVDHLSNLKLLCVFRNPCVWEDPDAID